MKRKNTYAVITGASSGIGKEFARRLAAEGYNLILVARRTERLQELAKEVEVFGTKTILLSADLSKISDCKKVIEEAERNKTVILINNAGFGDCGSFAESQLQKEFEMIDVNVKAVHYLTKRILKIFQNRNQGYILNVASSAGLIPAGPYMATYYATKAYVTSLTRAIARELKEQGSRVYIGCLCPGPVDTEFNDVANVSFALKGITASYCANYAVDQMKKRKVVIVPTLTMKCTVFFSRIIPQNLYIKLTGNQQKKKLGK
ncbi:MAG: SDR family oxidoreductase [Agathobacter sp.]|nr:SDR family oxidoreductase [Agathobacter sp.]